VLAFSGIVCVAPLWLGGLRGKKSTPSVGWEVPVRSHRSASGIWMSEHVGGHLCLVVVGKGMPVKVVTCNKI
jgi:hypothetical protein